MRKPTSTLLTADACKVLLLRAGWVIAEMPIIRDDDTYCFLLGTNGSSLLALEETNRTAALRKAYERVKSLGHITSKTVKDSMRPNWTD